MDESNLYTDTKSLAQAHTVCTTQVDKNIYSKTERFATGLEAEPQGYRHTYYCLLTRNT